MENIIRLNFKKNIIYIYIYIYNMGGGLMQLVAYGAQDIYLTGNPQITFFKVVYRRYTNFSIQSIRQTFNAQISASGTGGRLSATISRNGDLLYKSYIVLSNTNGSLATNYGHTSIDYVDVEIGGQRIDRQYGHFMETWSELTEENPNRTCGQLSDQMGTTQLSNYVTHLGSSSNGSFSSMITFTKFQAMSCAGGVAAPMQNITFSSLEQELYIPLRFWFCKEPGLALPLIALQYHEVKITVIFSSALMSTGQQLWCDYVYLDTDERRRFAQVSHEYLIEQVQLNTFSISSNDTRLNLTLNFNHPVKELIWNITPHLYFGPGLTDSTFQTIGDKDTTYLLKLNGHDRFEARPTYYFTRQQPYQYHTGNSVDMIQGFVNHTPFQNDTIGVYSFCLKPEEHQPSGTCNFSRIDNVEFIINEVSNLTSGNINVYAINYNVLRIMSGMGGLAYSN